MICSIAALSLRKLRVPVYVGIMLLLSACAPPQAQPDTPVPLPSPTHTVPVPPLTDPPAVPTEAETMPTPGSEPTPYDPAMQPLVQIALDDLSGRLGIPTDQIEVLEAESVVWGDTSMGCPQPGMAYLQVPQDGARIQLSSAGQVYNYHSGGNRSPFLCISTGPEEGKSTPFLGEDILTPPSSGDE